MRKNYVIFLLISFIAIFGFTVAYISHKNMNSISKEQAIDIAKVKFEEHLKEHPSYDFQDYTCIVERKSSYEGDYWSVLYERQGPNECYILFEFRVPINGDKVTMMTG